METRFLRSTGSTIRIPKPRIYYDAGVRRWIARDSEWAGCTGLGKTPVDAYLSWRPIALDYYGAILQTGGYGP